MSAGLSGRAVLHGVPQYQCDVRWYLRDLWHVQRLHARHVRAVGMGQAHQTASATLRVDVGGQVVGWLVDIAFIRRRKMWRATSGGYERWSAERHVAILSVLADRLGVSADLVAELM